MIPYGRQSLDESDIEAVVEVLRGDWLTTGPTVTAFEKALEELSGATRAVSCTSGTAALHIGYAAAGVGAGDAVVTTPMTFVATASSAMALGAEVLFVDIEDDTLNIDPALVEDAVTERTKVVAGVDYAGHPIEVDELRPITERTGTLLLEDAAHSIGSTYRGRPVGSLVGHHDLLVLPDQEHDQRRGRRRRHARPRPGAACARVPLHRARARPRADALPRRGAVAPGGARGRAELPTPRRPVRPGPVPAASACTRSRRGVRRSSRATRRGWPGSTEFACRRSASTSTRSGTSTRCGCSRVAGARSSTPCAGRRDRGPGQLHARPLAPGVRGPGLPARPVRPSRRSSTARRSRCRCTWG